MVEPEHAVMECTDGNKYGSFCGFYCIDGYELVGEPETLCLDSGSFTSPAPVCISKLSTSGET